jgi:hypothetical protein
MSQVVKLTMPIRTPLASGRGCVQDLGQTVAKCLIWSKLAVSESLKPPCSLMTN